MAKVNNMFDPEVISELRATFDKADAGKLTSYVLAWLSSVRLSPDRERQKTQMALD